MISLLILLLSLDASEANANMISCKDKVKDWTFELSIDANGNGKFLSKNAKSKTSYECKISADSIFDYTRSHASHYKLNLRPHTCSNTHSDFANPITLIIEQQNRTNKIKVQWLQTMEFEYCESGSVAMRDIKTSVIRFQKNTWPLKTK